MKQSLSGDMNSGNITGTLEEVTPFTTMRPT